MHRYLTTLNEDQPERSTEEYLGAFTESLKLIQQETPVERMGHAVLLAAKTALRLKAVMPKLQEHEIARRLQSIARGIRLFEILKDLTPEEKGMIKFNRIQKSSRRAAAKPRARRSVPRRRK
jgi:hypothetical protein